MRDVINGMLVRAHASSTSTGTAGSNTPVLTIPAGFPTTEVIQIVIFLIRISVSVDLSPVEYLWIVIVIENFNVIILFLCNRNSLCRVSPARSLPCCSERTRTRRSTFSRRCAWCTGPSWTARWARRLKLASTRSSMHPTPHCRRRYVLFCFVCNFFLKLFFCS